MRLARQDHLHRALRVREQRGEAPLVVEEQVRALVGRKAPREANGHRVQVELALNLAQDVGRLAVAGELARQPPLGEADQLALLLLMRPP